MHACQSSVIEHRTDVPVTGDRDRSEPPSYQDCLARVPSAERLHFELRDALCREYRRQLRTLWNHWDSFAAEQIRREYADALPQGATVYDVTYAVAREWRRVVNLVQPGLWFAMRSVEWKELE